MVDLLDSILKLCDSRSLRVFPPENFFGWWQLGQCVHTLMNPLVLFRTVQSYDWQRNQWKIRQCDFNKRVMKSKTRELTV
jgi:hypothetical protein